LRTELNKEKKLAASCLSTRSGRLTDDGSNRYR
jgi:hypothetical protein